MSSSSNPPDTTHHLHHSARGQWLLIAGLGMLAFVLGMIGFTLGWQDQEALSLEPLKGAAHHDLFDAAYHSARLFHMHFEFEHHPLPWQLQVARFLAPLALGLTLVKGFLFAARGHHRAFLHASTSGHVVICGLGEKGLRLAQECAAKGRAVVVIEKDEANPLLHACDQAGIFYWIGDATTPAVLSRARATHASEVIVITCEDEANVRIALQLRSLTAEKGLTAPECYVHLENIHLRDRLQREFEKQSRPGQGTRYRFFDVYDGEARRLLANLPLDGPGIAHNDPATVHVVIIGFGRMGRSIALRSAKMGHFANRKLLRISVIDRAANARREHFLFRHPVLERKDICDLAFHEQDAESLVTRRQIQDWAAEADTRLHIFVCLDDNARSLEVGLRLQECLERFPEVRLCVRFKSHASLAEILDASKDPTRPDLTPFGMIDDACCHNAIHHEFNESIACLGHESFSLQRQAGSKRKPDNDLALQEWNTLPEDLRESNRQQADHMAIKMRAIGCEIVLESDPRRAVTTFHTHEIERLAELEHTRWNAERWLAGWRYGTPSDKARRINENLVPWNELHDSIKQYDRDAIIEIPARLAAVSPAMKVVRRA